MSNNNNQFIAFQDVNEEYACVNYGTKQKVNIFVSIVTK